MPESAVAETGVRVEELLAALSADPVAGEQAAELVRLLMGLYGDGLERIVALSGGEVTGRLTADPLVAALLVLHDLHPVPLQERIEAALDEVRPYLGSHAGGVALLGIDDEGVAHVRLEGSCDGCPSSLVTMQTAVEQAVMKAAPEVLRVEADGVAAPASSSNGLHQIGSARKVGAWDPAVDGECPVPSGVTGVPADRVLRS